MNLDRAVFALTGVAVLLSLVLGVYLSPYFYLLTAFVGVNLVLAGTTGVCFSWAIFKKLGVPPGQALR